MKIKWNPIVKKDLQVTVRSMRISWGLFIYEGALAIAFLLALRVIQSMGTYLSSGNIYSYLIYLFPVTAVVQVCIVALYVPIITASSISGERERQTFDIMLTTCMSPLSIVSGKVASAVLRILFLVAASTPIMALSFVVGGLSWINLFYYLLALILFSVFSGSIGILSSSLCQKSITAVFLSFVINFVFFVMTFLPMLTRSIFGGAGIGESALPLLLNPGVFFEEVFMQMLTGESVFGNEGGTFESYEAGFLTYILARGKVWMFVSAGCILFVSLLFMFLAAWKVDPMHSGTGRRGSKNKAA